MEIRGKVRINKMYLVLINLTVKFLILKSNDTQANNNVVTAVFGEKFHINQYFHKFIPNPKNYHLDLVLVPHTVGGHMFESILFCDFG